MREDQPLTGPVYVGGHIGGGWEKTTFSDPGASSVFSACCGTLWAGAAASDARANSFLGGVQMGWMYQVGRLVVGGEYDWSWTRLNSDGAAFFPGIAGPTLPPAFANSFVNEAYSVSTKWTGTATTMIGIARDNWLFYSKVGAAWAHHEYGLAVNAAGITFGPPQINVPFGFAPPNISDTLVGWTVGTGVKWAISNNWFLNVEYDYMDFGSKGQNFSAVCAAPTLPPGPSGPCLGGTTTSPSTFNPTFNHRISEVKVGLNYKFVPGFLFW